MTVRCFVLLMVNCINKFFFNEEMEDILQNVDVLDSFVVY